MYVSHLSLTDFRSYAQVELPLDAGVTALVGPNGQGKTNLVEAIGYVATLASHRMPSDGGSHELHVQAIAGTGRHGNDVEFQLREQIERAVIGGRFDQHRVARLGHREQREMECLAGTDGDNEIVRIKVATRVHRTFAELVAQREATGSEIVTDRGGGGPAGQ